MSLTVGIMMLSVAAAQQPLAVVQDVDFERYQGQWYELARLPNRFQRLCASDVSASYSLREDGRIDVTNRCRKSDGSWSQAEGVARRAEADGPDGVLEVRFAPRWLSFLPFVWGDYRILALGPEYDHVLIGSMNRNNLWILARSTEMDEDTFERLVGIAEAQGFPVGQLQQTAHTDD